MLTKPRHRFVERLWQELTPALASAFKLSHESRPLQHPQMLGYCRRAKIKRSRNLGNCFLAVRQCRYDRASRRVGEREKYLTESLVILHRMVKYCSGLVEMSMGHS